MSWKLGVYSTENETPALREAIISIYAKEQPAVIRTNSYSFQHDYKALGIVDIEEILNPHAKHNAPVGLFATFESLMVNPGVKKEEYFVFSIPKLVAQIANKYAPIVTQFAALTEPVLELDSGKTKAPGIKYEKARLIASIVEASMNPIGPNCALRIFW